MAPLNFERYQRIAWFYDLLDLPFEFRRYRPIRPLLFEGLSGRILDAGVGTGRNFPFYPPAATVVGIDISPAMLEIAERRRGEATAPVELCVMDVTRLEFPARSFDAAVATFLFCVLPDELQVPGLRELARVVVPGGPIRLHVRPDRQIAPSPHQIVGTVGCLGLWRELRPQHRGACCGSRSRFGRSSLRRRRSDQADRGSGADRSALRARGRALAGVPGALYTGASSGDEEWPRCPIRRPPIRRPVDCARSAGR